MSRAGAWVFDANTQVSILQLRPISLQRTAAIDQGAPN